MSFVTIEEQTQRFCRAKGDLLTGESNLSTLADFCDQQYNSAQTAAERGTVLGKSRQYAVQALGSLAFQVNESAAAVLGMLDLVSDSQEVVLAHADQLSLQIEVHREKIAKREASEVSVERRIEREKKVDLPKRVQVPVYPGHTKMNLAVLDNIGCGGTGELPEVALAATSAEVATITPTIKDDSVGGSSELEMRTKQHKAAGVMYRATDSEGRVSHNLSFCSCMEQVNSSRPPLELPATEPFTRPRSASLNDIDLLAKQISSLPDVIDSDTKELEYEYVPITPRQLRRSTGSHLPPPDQERSRSRSLGARPVAGDSDWPAVASEERRHQGASSRAATLMPVHPPPEEMYDTFSPQGSNASSTKVTRDSLEYAVDDIEYEGVMYETVEQGENEVVDSKSLTARCSEHPSIQKSEICSPPLFATHQSSKLKENGNLYSAPAPRLQKRGSDSKVPDWVPEDILGVGEAMYNFVPIEDDHLPMQQGDIVYVLSPLAADQKWYTVLNTKADQGIVPCRYVRLVAGSEPGSPPRYPSPQIAP